MAEYRALAINGQDKVTIYPVGDDTVVVAVAKWPTVSGEVTGIGQSVSITLSRHTLIGLAYEILHTESYPIRTITGAELL